MATKKIIVIAGPTASGKSQLALAIAQESDAVIINADSMQVYAAIPVLSAQPTLADKSAVPHQLYGILESTLACSAGMWLSLAKTAIDNALAQGKQPIIVGGTGLYLKTLIQGISPIPAISEELRQQVRSLFSQLGNSAFHALLTERDPVMAARLHAGDSQRMIRSMEVLDYTGISLAEWQKIPPVACYKAEDFVQITLIPPRPLLYSHCNSRFCSMMGNGALQEVEALIDEGVDTAMPVMKALGIAELHRYLTGVISREEALQLAQTATRQYAKRQITWFRYQMPESRIFSYEGSRDEQQAIIKTCYSLW